MANRIQDLKAHAAASDGELGIVVRAVHSLKELVVAGETCRNSAEVWAFKTSDKLSELLSLVEGLIQAVTREHERFMGLVEWELSQVRSIITAALT